MKIKFLTWIHLSAWLLLLLGNNITLSAQSCEQSHSLNGVVSVDESYKAQTTISSSQVIEADISVNYFAGEKITLTSGFSAREGCTFQASIEGCTVNIMDEESDKIFISNFPNPFTDQTKFVFTLKAQSKVSLIIFNSIGQPVAKVLEEEIIPSGKHQRIFNANHLSPGIYFYTFEIGNENASGRMVIQQ